MLTQANNKVSALATIKELEEKWLPAGLLKKIYYSDWVKLKKR